MIKRTHKRFGRGLRSCSARVAASSAILAGSLMTADAAIIFSNTVIVDTDVGTTTTAAVDFLTVGKGGPELHLNTELNKSGPNAVSWESFGSSFSFISTLKGSSEPVDIMTGTIIDGSSANYSTDDSHNFAGTNPYVGFSFNPGNGNGTLNGWLKVDTSTGTNGQMSITSWAFEDTGASIEVGQVPEPSSALLVVAGGMLGLTLRRRMS